MKKAMRRLKEVDDMTMWTCVVNGQSVFFFNFLWKDISVGERIV